MIKLILAMAVVTANLVTRRSHDPAKVRAESIDIEMRRLAGDLGYEPARTPPRS